MAVEKINSTNNNKHNGFKTLAQGAGFGATAGIAGKYLIPLTYDETHSDEYIKVMGRIHSQKNEYNFRTDKFINSLQNKKLKSLADEEFINMFDGLKFGDKMPLYRIRKALEKLQSINPLEAAEFRNICKETNKLAESTAKQCVNAYNLVTKHIRPTGFFVATGAALGIATAFTNKILKADNK